MSVTRTEPRTQVDAEAEMQHLSYLIEGTPDRTPSEAEKVEWRARQDEVLALWRTLPDDHKVD